MEPQKTPIANTIMRKKNKTESIMLPDFRNQNSMILAENRHTDQWNRIETPEINPHT